MSTSCIHGAGRYVPCAMWGACGTSRNNQLKLDGDMFLVLRAWIQLEEFTSSGRPTALPAKTMSWSRYRCLILLYLFITFVMWLATR
ncbi:uncharacterized protein BDZ83DRAFT_38680 [Colletotrichum acutatum]|uniref:Uncharacterized protein n=1 Tax=Glomerella acutata TaxID=27357 RepID=A0AAD8UAU7_GLOAC|nr:uncharacterized protein BDZ83DRAFT_38680 [Colletotrichum acutatum]KAK1716802.1 hypothetical protein BDZ83DRAFT_38680 [Colletotrichum acutatum]